MILKNSPGVSIQELDQTTSIQSGGGTIGAFCGIFHWGPVLYRTLITSEVQLATLFGAPVTSTVAAIAQDFLVAAQFLTDSQSLYVVRVVGSTATNAVSLGGSLLIKNQDDYDTNWSAGQDTGTHGVFVAKYPGAKGNGIKIAMCDSGNFGAFPYASSFTGTPGTSDFVTTASGSNDELHIAVVDTLGSFGTVGAILERFAFVSKAGDAKNSDGTSNYYADVVNRTSKYIWWMNHPTGGTNWGNTAASTAYVNMPTVLVYSSVTGTYTVAETVNVFSGPVGSIAISGSMSGYTTVPTVAITGGGGTGATATAAIGGGSITSITVTNGGKNFTSVPTVTITGGGGTGAIGTATVTYGSFAVKSGIVTNYNSGSHTLTINNILGTFAITDSVVGASSAAVGIPTSVTPSAIYAAQTLAGGNTQAALVTDGLREIGWSLYANPEDVEVEIIVGSVASLTLASYLISNLAEVRKTAVLTLSPRQSDVVLAGGNELNNTIAYANLLPSSSYTILDCNWQQVYNKYSDSFSWIPCSGSVAGLVARTDSVAAPWLSPAGLNRGSIKNVIKLAWNPGSEAIRDQLYNNSVNPILYIRGSGPVLYGDKTFLRKPSQFGHINVRRLFLYIEAAMKGFARFTLFQNNTPATQSAFRAQVTPFLRTIEGQGGILDFKVVCDASNNTSDILAANGFVADLYIDAAPSINNIYINMIGTPTGISISTQTGTGV